MKKLSHFPVMKKEVIHHLNIKPNGVYLDCTLGAGGHSLGILEKLNSSGLLIGIDSDEKNIQPTHTRFSVFKKNQYTLHHSNFIDFPEILKKIKVDSLDGILLDLGLSSMELDEKERGFSFQKDGPLDMRFNINEDLTASKLIKRASSMEISTIIKKYGEERNYKKISKAIKESVNKGKMDTTFDLKQAILEVTPSNFSNKTMARVFQAIRIAVNDELNILKLTLNKTTNYLKKGGKLVVIAYHSLEDRIIKKFISKNTKTCICPIEIPICKCSQMAVFKNITKKPLLPQKKEILTNSRSRSAKMRVAERI